MTDFLPPSSDDSTAQETESEPSNVILESDGFPEIKETRSGRGCPSCGHRFYDKVRYTIWGGVIGPKLMNHVKCKECGTTFNSSTGKSNFVPILIYGVVTAVVAFVLFYAAKAWLIDMVSP